MSHINIAKLMIPRVFTEVLYEDDSVSKALTVMKKHGYTAIPVLDQKEQFVGCVSEGDFLKHFLNIGDIDLGLHKKFYVRDIVRKDFCPPVTIDTGTQEIIAAISNQNFVPVVDCRNMMCGILTRKAIIEYLYSHHLSEETK